VFNSIAFAFICNSISLRHWGSNFSMHVMKRSVAAASALPPAAHYLQLLRLSASRRPDICSSNSEGCFGSAFSTAEPPAAAPFGKFMESEFVLALLVDVLLLGGQAADSLLGVDEECRGSLA
jgi:hypothetical protein